MLNCNTIEVRINATSRHTLEVHDALFLEQCKQFPSRASLDLNRNLYQMDEKKLASLIDDTEKIRKKEGQERGRGMDSLVEVGCIGHDLQRYLAASSSSPPASQRFSLLFSLAKWSYHTSLLHLTHRFPHTEVECTSCFLLCAKLFSLFFFPIRQGTRTACGFTLHDLVQFRQRVREVFQLEEEDMVPLRQTTYPNDDKQFEKECIKEDMVFFPTGYTTTAEHPTLSVLPVKRRKSRKGDPAASSSPLVPPPPHAALNSTDDIPTFGYDELFRNGEWQQESIGDTCPKCQCSLSRWWRSWWNGGVAAHHCRRCGRRFCVSCMDGSCKAHKSFASLKKPETMEGDMRMVCPDCFSQYENLNQYHYLVSLFAFAGLDIMDLLFCRAVNYVWRHAAELFISEYRVLLHSCHADFNATMAPVNLLLLHSTDRIVPFSGEGGIHPEVALLVLRRMQQTSLWGEEGMQFVKRLAEVSLERLQTPPCLSHLHFFCTSTCSALPPLFFFQSALELVAEAAPSSEEETTRYAHAVRQLTDRVVQCLEVVAADPRSHAYLELCTMKLVQWILHDHSPFQRTVCYQKPLEQLIPPLCRSSTVCAMNLYFTIQSMSTTLASEEKRKKMLAWMDTVEGAFEEPFTTRMRNTLRFFHTMDTVFSEKRISVDFVLRWLESLAVKPSATSREEEGEEGDALRVSATASLLPLPFEMLDPFDPSVVLTATDTASVKVMSSAERPLVLAFCGYRTVVGGGGRVPVRCRILYKQAKVVQDQLLCISIRLMTTLLGEKRCIIPTSLEAVLPRYSVLPLADTRSGIIQMAPGTVLSHLAQDYNNSSSSAALSEREESASSYASPSDVHPSPPSAFLFHYIATTTEGQLTDQSDRFRLFLISAKVFLLVNYIFDLGDRHRENVMISPDGAIFHIDFGFIFSEKNLVETVVRNSVRIDQPYLEAVARCSEALFPDRTREDGTPWTAADRQEHFFKETAEWFVLLRPYVNLFFELWRNGAYRHVLPARYVETSAIAALFEDLFDRGIRPEPFSREFERRLRRSINKCRFSDTAHGYVKWVQEKSEQVKQFWNRE